MAKRSSRFRRSETRAAFDHLVRQLPVEMQPRAMDLLSSVVFKDELRDDAFVSGPEYNRQDDRSDPGGGSGAGTLSGACAYGTLSLTSGSGSSPVTFSGTRFDTNSYRTGSYLTIPTGLGGIYQVVVDVHGVWSGSFAGFPFRWYILTEVRDYSGVPYALEAARFVQAVQENDCTTMSRTMVRYRNIDAGVPVGMYIYQYNDAGASADINFQLSLVRVADA